MKYKAKDGSTLCIVHKENEWSKGLDFLSSDDDFIQVGTWWYDNGKELDKHFHNEFERTATRTQECVYIISGKMQVDLYDFDSSYIESFEVEKGDIAIFTNGGHGYKILEDDTRILETKNGPFYGVQKDKTRF